MHDSRIAPVLLVAGTLALGACGGNSSPNTSQQSAPPVASAEALQQEVTFDLDLSALLAREILPGTLDDPTSVANLMEGSMKVTDLTTGGIEYIPWTVNIDESNLANVQSFQTLVLVPGNYAFELAVSKGTHSYSGSTVYNLSDGDAESVAMTIRPVIGDLLVDANTIAELIDFRFSFSASDINTANLANPSMGITIDGSAEQIFTLSPATGLSEHMFLNLQPGQYDISLRLLDNGIQVGKSIEVQGRDITVSQGLDVSMDIVPLHGEIAFSLSAEGADANLNLQVPPEVIEEVGGLANLQTILSVTGPGYPLLEQPLSLAENGGSYTAALVLPDVFYGELTFEMSFTDTTDSNEIGYCFTSTLVSNASASISCDLTLRRRQIVSGNLMSTVGINVRDVDGAAIPGAVISIGEEEVAITNGAAFSTPGYSKVYVASGTHTVRAQLGAAFGIAEYTSEPLSVSNIAIVLDRLDTDGDGIEDNLDACPTEASESANGCPSTLVGGDLVSAKAAENGHVGQVTVRLNDGQGGFTPVAAVNPVGNTHHSVTAADFNGDGIDDVAALGGNGAIGVALGPFSGGMNMVQVAQKTEHARDILAGDFNNDDVIDLISIGHYQHAVFLGNGDGSFGSELPFSAIAGDNRDFALGDFDQDGNLDVTINSNGGNCLLAIHYGDGTGNFPAADTEFFGGLLNLLVETGDIDGDGDLDILTAGYGYGLRVFTNNGNRSFTPSATTLYDTDRFLLAEDFNGDNAADLIISDNAEAIHVRLNDGAGNFGDPVIHTTGARTAREAVIFDVNADGKKDVAIINADIGGYAPQSNNITIMTGNDDGTFQTPYVIPGERHNWQIAAGNFD